MELYDPRRDAWAAGPVMPAPASFAAAAMLGGQVYVVEGTAHAPHVLSLERHKRLWGACQPLAKPRVNMAVCALEDRLYVLVSGSGGLMRHVAMPVQPSDACLLHVSGSCLVPLQAVSLGLPAIPHHRALRCVPGLAQLPPNPPIGPCPQGGRAGIGKGASVLRDVEIFDPTTNTWCSGAPMVRLWPSGPGNRCCMCPASCWCWVSGKEARSMV